ncbi:MAG: hypothetical protein IKS42_11345 [Oscillospiraceae bacterium]|nr:hypothetical protein [Oscillospiraceae bacterium]
MILLLILAGLCIYTAYAYNKKRKFYLEHGREIAGEVLFFEKRRGWKGQKNFPYYMLKVAAEGREYLIETNNPKARKYGKQTDIVLFVPEEIEDPLSEENLAFFGAKTPEERAKIADFYTQSPDMERELDRITTHMRTNMAIIKEDLPGLGVIIFIAVFGAFLLALAVIPVIKAISKGTIPL